MISRFFSFIWSWFSAFSQNKELKETNFEQMNEIKEMEGENETEHYDDVSPGKYTL